MSHVKLACLQVFALFLLSGSLSTFARDLPVHDVDYIPGSDYENAKDKLDIYMPRKAKSVPVIVFFHGGALQIGSKEDARVVASRFTPAGVGIVTPNYRLSPSVMHPAHVEDAAAVVAWVVNNIQAYGGDPKQIYLAGHSAGAYLAVLLNLDDKYLLAHALRPEIIQGTIAISPFLYVEETARERPKIVWGTDPVDWLAASVTPHIESGKGRMLLIYADGDEDWRKRQNETFGRAMRAVENDVLVVEVPERDHMTLIEKMNNDDDRIRDQVLQFIGLKK